MNARGGKAIADALASNSVLTSLDLDGIMLFDDAQHTCATAHIEATGVEAMGAMLRRNTTLRRLYFHGKCRGLRLAVLTVACAKMEHRMTWARLPLHYMSPTQRSSNFTFRVSVSSVVDVDDVPQISSATRLRDHWPT